MSDSPKARAVRETHRPPIGLGDADVPDVPATTPSPDESEAEAAARIGRTAQPEQDPWGDSEDRPDHDTNEVYVQQEEARP